MRQILFLFLTGYSIFHLLDIAHKQFDRFNINLSTVWEIISYLTSAISFTTVLLKFDLYVPQAYVFDKNVDRFIIRHWYWFRTKSIEYPLSEIRDVNVIRSPLGASAAKLTMAAGNSLILYSFWTLIEFDRPKVQRVVDRLRSFLVLDRTIAGDGAGDCN
jgi:hypothetical protein